MTMNFQGGPGLAAINYRGSAGFTLIELMTVLVIFTILMAVGIPAVNQMMAGQGAKSVAADLHTSLTLARAEAVVRNRPVTVSPLAADDDWAAEGWQVTVGTGSDLIVLHRQDLKPEMVTITSARDALEFRPSGRVKPEAGDPADGTIRLEIESVRDASQTRCVVIRLDGRARSGACDDANL